MTTPLFFLHIPKTAGTSLRSWLAEQYRAEEVMPLRWPLTREGPIRELPLAPSEYRGLERFSLISEHVGADLWSTVRGTHLGFTVLREPRDRVVSFYWNIRTKQEHNLCGAPPVWRDLWTRANAMGIAEFLTDPPPSIRKRFFNAQVRQLATNLADLTPESQDLSRAKRTLDEFRVVGVTEMLESTLRLVCHATGWPIPTAFPHFAPTPGRPALDQLSDEDRRAIDHVTALDQQLYRAALARLDRDLSSISHTNAVPTIEG